MTTVATSSAGSVARRQAQFRYGVVFVLVLALLVFQVIAPGAAWARAIDVTLIGAALTVAVATSRSRGSVRRLRALLVAAVALAVVVGIAVGLVSSTVAFAAETLLVAATPIALVGGLLRLIRDGGVTLQAVAGALAIYLLIGLLFASIIDLVSELQSGRYFAQPGSITAGDRVYYSFTVLTTTGFGDYTPVAPVGHALAVLEMLTGQLYLVTVIGILVGSFVGQRKER